MTLNQSALLELTQAMRTADDGKPMRTLLHTILQVAEMLRDTKERTTAFADFPETHWRKI